MLPLKVEGRKDMADPEPTPEEVEARRKQDEEVARRIEELRQINERRRREGG
jgi:hypothetical protein